MGNVNTSSYRDNLQNNILIRSGSILPVRANSFDVGSSSFEWRNVNTFNLSASSATINSLTSSQLTSTGITSSIFGTSSWSNTSSFLVGDAIFVNKSQSMFTYWLSNGMLAPTSSIVQGTNTVMIGADGNTGAGNLTGSLYITGSHDAGPSLYINGGSSPLIPHIQFKTLNVNRVRLALLETNVNNFAFYDANGTASMTYVIGGTPRIGIGNTNPLAGIDISGSIWPSVAASFDLGNPNGPTRTWRFLYVQTVSGSLEGTASRATSSSFAETAHTASFSSGSFTIDNNGILFINNSVARVAASSSRSQLKLTGADSLNTAARIELTGEDASGTVIDNLNVGGSILYSTKVTGSHVFVNAGQTGSNAGSVGLLTIRNTGNISIGNWFDPQFALQVSGTVAPSGSGLFDLGATSSIWNNGYISSISSSVISSSVISSSFISTINTIYSSQVSSSLFGTASNANFALTASYSPNFFTIEGLGRLLLINATARVAASSSRSQLKLTGADSLNTSGRIELTGEDAIGSVISNLNAGGSILYSTKITGSHVFATAATANSIAGTIGLMTMRHTGKISVGNFFDPSLMFQVSGTIGPSGSNLFDLGADDTRFRNIYFSGSIQGQSYTWSGSFVNFQTPNTYSLSSGDNGKLLSFNSSSLSQLVLSSSLPYGFRVDVYQSGSGQIVIDTGSTDTTLRNRQNQKKTAGQYAVVTIWRIQNGDFVLYGDTGA